MALFSALGILSTIDGIYMVFYAVGNGFFYFLPIMLGYTAAEHFHCNEFIGAAIGAAGGAAIGALTSLVKSTCPGVSMRLRV